MTADDYFAIQRLVFSYPRFLDQGNLAAMAQLFEHADVHFQDGRVCRSNPRELQQIFADFVRIYPDDTPRTRHLTANLIIEPAGTESAIASCYVVVFQQTAELPLQPIIAGDYRDRFARVDGEWRFIERFIGNDLFGDLGAHGKYDFAPL
ncbi:MAG: nuclear transport factor 2 family protein [Gammaproteobacteria bacterium]|uniref:nuclear transport factor 2 family protein n=1 Tax=Pseudomaricurvus alcaniphilus TaxID=1166482 RepID=UPI001407A7D5|nr:nuclear transport factor 2 family protein [Pseudomaricurvus alcaniphilus]MBR9911377.1 nuclear transport factor 2 family protein [Gammaproteobacteria bacterium]NHN36833.1 nuclear transport factor 2 family protein [Pseudomaricurvus alcaniphilus]